MILEELDEEIPEKTGGAMDPLLSLSLLIKYLPKKWEAKTSGSPTEPNKKKTRKPEVPNDSVDKSSRMKGLELNRPEGHVRR